jgi:endo-1,4-beta-xylanase
MLGEDPGLDTLIAHAFRYARQANPHPLLLLNETFGHQGLARPSVDMFFYIVPRQKAAGTPIDAVGTEMHLEAPLRSGYLDEFRYFLTRARQAGVQAYVTEMDVYQGHPSGSTDLMARQAQIFHDVVSACLEDSNCKGFYTWGISDAHSWPASRPYQPLLDAQPLLFDGNYNKKPAYYGVLRALTEHP